MTEDTRRLKYNHERKVNLSNCNDIIDSNVISIAINKIELPENISRIEIRPDGIFGILKENE